MAKEPMNRNDLSVLLSYICPANDNIMPISCHKHIYKIKTVVDIVVFIVLREPRDSRVCQTL